ncbi:MAG: translation initiation factor IF-2, partial [Flavobacteriales bacterium]
MSETTDKAIRLSKVAREFNQGLHTVVEFLAAKGYTVEQNPNAKIGAAEYELLQSEFGTSKAEKEASKQTVQARAERESVTMSGSAARETAAKVGPLKEVKPAAAEAPAPAVVTSSAVEKPAPPAAPEPETIRAKVEKAVGPKTLGKIDLSPKPAPEPPAKKTTKGKAEPPQPPAPVPPPPPPPPAPEPAPEPELIRAKFEKLAGVKSLGKIELPVEKKSEPRGESEEAKRRRKRIVKPGPVNVDRAVQQETRTAPRGPLRPGELDENAVKKKVSETLARLTGGGGKGRGAKMRREKRDQRGRRFEEEMAAKELAGMTLKVTEFVTASELASMMSVPVTDIIKACFALGMMVSINQRLDAETLAVIAEEYGFKVEFVGADVQEEITSEVDNEARVTGRPPIVTVMGHVDHGKTSLLDHIRKANVIAGEAGGITQHIGAYSVALENGKRITFLDTPGHEAFTAMRARGAQVTDLAIIVIAADDSVMPQTREAINHAQAAGVPMVFAFNKIDKADANAEKIREQLSQMNILVEEWGGKFQTQEISAKKGQGVDQLLEKVLLEAELLELKADPGKRAHGVVIESTLEQGRGYVTTLLVDAGTLRKGDIILAGQFSGRVRNMFNERGQAVAEAGPSTPVSILGLDGAPNAGDTFQVFEDERDARTIATRRQQLQREQGIRTHKHITLDEIGRRLAIGDFRELNVIVKGDVDGSVEALTDSLLKLSTQSIKVSVIHKAVGPIAESDVLLASASNAIIVGFQVRPTPGARKLAETEEIDIRLY